VEIEGDVYALKCVKTTHKQAYSLDVGIHTPQQDEAAALINLPLKLKHLFVTTYAHGRMYIEDGQGGMKYDTEVILMEKLGTSVAIAIAYDLLNILQSNQRNDMQTIYASNALQLWSSAFKMIRELHNNNYIHGDSHHDNFLFSRDNKNFKFIDAERVQNLEVFSKEMQTLMKLSDIHHALFKCRAFLVYARSRGLDAASVNFEKLHKRLKYVKNSLGLQNPDDFLLDDVILYHDGLSNIAVKPTSSDESYIQNLNEDQFARLRQINTDNFLAMLCNPGKLYHILMYMVSQMRSIDSTQIDKYDRDVPTIEVHTPGAIAVPQPPLPQQKPVTFYNYNLCAPTSASDFGALSYTKNGNTLMCYRRGTDGKNKPFEITEAYYMRTIVNGSLQMIYQNPNTYANYTKNDTEMPLAGFVPVIFTIQRNPARLLFWYDFGNGQYSVQYHIDLP
jgi:hypothetical protein